MQGKVLKLFISTVDKQRKDLDFIELDEEGVLNDKFHSKGVERSILISSNDSYSLVKEHGITIPYGSLGENVILDINPYTLSAGDKIEVGEVVLEITQNCTICNSLAKVAEGLPEILKTDRGIFARTYKGGKIYVGDKVNIIR